MNVECVIILERKGICLKRMKRKKKRHRLCNAASRQKFNVFRVRALYYTKDYKHQRIHKEFFINYNTLLQVSALLGHLQGENFPLSYKPRPQRIHASINGAVHSQQHILAQLYSATYCNDNGKFSP
jgi:hypothetical protein